MRRGQIYLYRLDWIWIWNPATAHAKSRDESSNPAGNTSLRYGLRCRQNVWRTGAKHRNKRHEATTRTVSTSRPRHHVFVCFLGLVPKQTTNGRHKRGTTTRQERLVSDLCRSCRRRDTCSFVSFVGRCSPRRMQFEASCRNETATVAARGNKWKSCDA